MLENPCIKHAGSTIASQIVSLRVLSIFGLGYFQCLAMDGVDSVDRPPLLGETYDLAHCGIECHQPVSFPLLQLFQVLLELGMIFR